LRVRDLARGDLRQVGVGHLGQRDLEDVQLLALDKGQEELERPFEHRRLDVEARGSDWRFHEEKDRGRRNLGKRGE